METQTGLYDVKAMANLLNVSERAVTKMIREGTLKGKKLGKKWYIKGEDIKAHFDDK